MDRQPPSATSDGIDLYLHTDDSLLRSTGQVKVRAFGVESTYACAIAIVRQILSRVLRRLATGT